MKAGLLQQEGESVEKAAKETAGNGNKEEEEVRDAAGNIIDMKKEAKLSDKEKKKVLNVRVQLDFFVARGVSSSNVNSQLRRRCISICEVVLYSVVGLIS